MRSSLFVAALFALPLPALADPPAGQIDPTFGGFGGGILGLQLEGFDLGGDWHDGAFAMAEDAEGRLLLAGIGETDDGECLGLMRFTPDGQLDATDFGFNQNNVAQGKVCHTLPVAYADLGRDLDIARLPDGGFLVGGNANHETPYVCRFHADGRLRLDFAGGCVSLVQINTDGHWPAPDVLVAGPHVLVIANNNYDLGDAPVLSRIALDTGELIPFGQQTFVPLLPDDGAAVAWDALLTDDGALILVGNAQEDEDDVDAFVARFDLQDMQPDPAFDGDGRMLFRFNEFPLAQDYFNAITALPGGNVLIAGSVEMDDMPNRAGLVIVELDPATGTLAPAFNGGSPKIHDPCADVDGGCFDLLVNEISAGSDHIVVAGHANMESMFAARLHRNGAVDPSFGSAGLALLPFLLEATGLVLQGDRIVLAGTSDLESDYDFGLLRLSGGRLFSDQFESTAP